MRFAIIYRPKDPPSPEQMPQVLQDMAGWMQSYGDRLENVNFFVGGGGFGTIETDDAAELTRLITENPFSVHSEIEIKALVDPATAIGILQESYS
jgi:hypothetical protein